MEYRYLGNSGLQVSVTGLGCNNFGGRCDKEATAAVIDKAIDVGINLFDTADVYGGGGKSEELIGDLLGDRRHQVVLATKFAAPMGKGPHTSGGSRKYIMSEVEASLRRLRTDYIDLYQVHFPDMRTPIEETMRALDDLVTAGKVRYIGHSNFSGWQTAECHYLAKANGWTPFISAQNEYSLLERTPEKELVPACQKFGLGILPYFPLASGFLSGKYRRGEPAPEGTRFGAWGPLGKKWMTDPFYDKLERLEGFAGSRGHTILELAMSWLACRPAVASVIAGATRPDQVEQNAAATEWKLTPEEMAEIDGILA